MALTTYTVKRGDNLTKIANGSCGKNVASSISGSTVSAKIDTLVKLNNIKNRNLIYVGQVLKLSGSASAKTSNAPDVPQITAFGLQSEDTTGRAMYVAWSFSKTNLKNFKVRWSYFADNIWFMAQEGETESYESAYCSGTYSAPANASKVKVRIAAIAKENSNNKKYWNDIWSSESVYDFNDNPPYVPGSPSIEIKEDPTTKELSLVASLENVDPKVLNADSIEFEIVKDNTFSLGTYAAPINTVSNYVSYSHAVEPGSEYKVRARGKKGEKVSGWTEFSGVAGTRPNTPDEIIECKAKTYSANEISAYLSWTPVTNADSYDIEYTTNINYFDGTDQTSTVSGITFTHHEIMSLGLGEEYFFRVRANNIHGSSLWSEIKSVVLGKTPIAPTTWSSTTTAIVGEPLNLYWVHNAEDGSSETFAEIRLFVNDVQQVPDITVKNDRPEEDKDKTQVYALDTTAYPEGSKIKWQVRTAGVTKVYGDWSTPRIVDIYAKPTLQLAVSTLPNGAGEMIDTLTSFPFYIYALAGPKTQSPISYQLRVTSNEYYETVDDTGLVKMVNKGEDIYSKHFDTMNALIVEMSADNLNIEADIEYTITCLVSMNSGLTAEASHTIKADWDDIPYNINANVSIDSETLTALITPFCEDSEGTLVEDITLSVYRREFDGSFKEIAKNIPNTNNVTVSDPHPALDYARYRIVGKTISTGAVSYYDLAGVEVGGKAVVIQWNEEWSTFDATEENNAERPPWSGSMLVIPYNIDVSDSHNVDVELISYIGRKYPVAYYGTQLGSSSNWNVEIPRDDKNTLYAIRRLAVWTGDVYVREPSGSGYWANISVSYNQPHNEVTTPVTFTITRVEGGI